jgi:hypothetical protein
MPLRFLLLPYLIMLPPYVKKTGFSHEVSDKITGN